MSGEGNDWCPFERFTLLDDSDLLSSLLTGAHRHAEGEPNEEGQRLATRLKLVEETTKRLTRRP